MAYLLNRDFRGTVKKWIENPEGLELEIREILSRATVYAKELKAKGIPQLERDEYVQHFIAPTDIPDEISPDEDLYEEIMTWAAEMGQRLSEEKG